jgi:hypothetical protein
MTVGSTIRDIVLSVLALLVIAGLVKAWFDYWKTLDSVRRFWVWALAITGSVALGIAVYQHEAYATSTAPASPIWPWLALLLAIWPLFIVWSWVPTERLDERWPLNNEVGRPLMNSLVLTGLPALYAGVTHLPNWGLLVPICLILTAIAVLSGRVLVREAISASATMMVATLSIWTLLYISQQQP